MDDLTILPGRNLTRPAKETNSVALLAEIMGRYIAPLQASRDFRAQWQASGLSIGSMVFGEGAIETSPLRYLAEAKRIHAGWLRHYSEIEAAHSALTEILMGFERVDPLTATRMVAVLLAALGKKKSDEETGLLLAATTDMLSPLDAAVAITTKLWEPVNAHPFVLAVAIKALIAKAVFTSASELREEMGRVSRNIALAASAMSYLAETIGRADEIVFVGDRATWSTNYADVDSGVAAAMRDSLIREAPDIDDDGSEIPPSDRWRALDEKAGGTTS